MRNTTRLLTDNNTSSHSKNAATSEISGFSIKDIFTVKDMSLNKPQSGVTTKQIKQNLCHCLWIFLGILLFVGCIQILWAPTYLENAVHDGIVDAFIFTEPRPDDENYAKWITNDQGPDDSIPINVYISFYNVTNPDDILRGELPKFSCTPPIVYTEWYYRENVTFSDDGTRARSYFKTKFIYDPVKSQISENDTFTIIAPLVGALTHLYESTPNPPESVFDFIFASIDKDPSFLYMRGTAKQLIFSILEFNVPLLDIEYLYGMLNNNSGSWYITHTGYKDEYRMGEVVKWSNQKQYGWNATEYNEDGDKLINFDDNNHYSIDCWDPKLLYSPSHFIYQGVYAIKDDPRRNMPPFFVSTLKKPLIFDYHKAVKYHNIPAEQYNFSMGQQLMNDTQYPPNSQFNQFGPSGVLNLTACFSNLPLFFSLPNFLGAPDYAKRNKEFGLDVPNEHRDLGYLQVEPMTGAILNADIPLQGDVLVAPIPDYGYNSSTNGNQSLVHLQKFMAPTYLLRYEAHLPDKGAKELSAQIALANELDSGFHIFGYICIGLMVFYWAYTWYWFGKNGYKHLFPGLCCK